ncbi:MAG TPA: hypothetical protein VGK67_10190 [Myxococcales bacterium]|jgi:hypothetical protein
MPKVVTRPSAHRTARAPKTTTPAKKPARAPEKQPPTPAKPKASDTFEPAKPAATTSPVAASCLNGVEPASQALMEAVKAHGRTIQIAQPGSDEMRYLDYMGAEANVGGVGMTDILLRAHPSKAGLLEEFLHGTQAKLGMLDQYGQQACEVKIKDFMVRHAKMLGLSAEDVAILQKLKVEEQKLLDQAGGR